MEDYKDCLTLLKDFIDNLKQMCTMYLKSKLKSLEKRQNKTFSQKAYFKKYILSSKILSLSQKWSDSLLKACHWEAPWGYMLHLGADGWHKIFCTGTIATYMNFLAL